MIARMHPYPSRIRVSQIPDSWCYIVDSQDREPITADLEPAARAIVEDEDIRAYFVDQEDADRRAVYGIAGSVAHTWKTAIRLYPLDTESDPEYPIELRRDGEILEQFTDVDSALMHLHRIQSSSYSHAIMHEGYSVTRLGVPEPIALLKDHR